MIIVPPPPTAAGLPRGHQPPARPAADHAPRGRGRRNRGAVRDGESGRRSRCGESLIRHAAPNAIGALPVAVVEAPFGTALMSSPRRLHRPPATERPAGWCAVGVAAVAGRADREETAAMATGALAERVVHGVGARRAGPDWTARRIRGTTAGTGSVCRSSRRSRGSRKPLRALTPRLSPPRTLPERAAPRQRRGCGRCRSRGRKRARPPELAKPRRRGFAQRPQPHCCWYFNLNELNDGPEDRQVSRFAPFYVTADRRRLGHVQVQKRPQTQRIGHPPRDPPLGRQPFEIADEQQTEIPARP